MTHELWSPAVQPATRLTKYCCVISAEIKVTVCNENACRDKPKHKFMKAQPHFSKILIKTETVKEIIHTKMKMLLSFPTRMLFIFQWNT